MPAPGLPYPSRSGPDAGVTSRRPPNVSRETLRWPNNHAPVWFLAETLGLNAVDCCDRVVDNLPLSRGHRLELMLLATADDPLRCRLHDRDQPVPLPGPEAVDVEQQPDPPLGLPENGDTGQFLKGIERLAIGTDEYIQVRAFEINVATGLVDPRRDVAVDVERVQEALEEVAGPLSVSFDQLRLDWLIGEATSRPGRVRPFRYRWCGWRLLYVGGCR